MSAPREIKLASVRSLRPDKRNARTHSKKQNSADRKEHPTLRLDLSNLRLMNTMSSSQDTDGMKPTKSAEPTGGQ